MATVTHIIVAEEAGTYDFAETFSFAERRGVDFDRTVILQMIPGCVEVVRADAQADRNGTDYYAVLNSGRRLRIDAKARDKGCSKFWKHGPEMALETWSVVPDGGSAGKIGWTLDRAKTTDLVLFTYDLTDCAACFLEPFLHLQLAFERRREDWYKSYPHWKQTTRSSSTRSGWQSECVFVPAAIVQEAIKEVSIGWFK